MEGFYEVWLSAGQGDIFEMEAAFRHAHDAFAYKEQEQKDYPGWLVEIRRNGEIIL